MEEIRNKIMEFIKDQSKHEIEINNKYLVMKHIYKGNVFIYMKHIFGEKMGDLMREYTYHGFYNLKTNKFYDLRYSLSTLLDITKTLTSQDLEKQMLENIIKKISDELKTNSQKYFREPLELNEELSEYVEHWGKNRAINSAKLDFFTDQVKSLKDFIHLDFINSGIKQIDIDEIIEYIEAPEKILNYYKEEFLNKNIQQLYAEFKIYTIYQKHITDIKNDKLHIIHRQKELRNVIQDKKTVTVTIVKDGHTFTFKTETQEFLRLDEFHGCYTMSAKDRVKYKELFGHDDYTIDEIISVKYGKQEIYSNVKKTA